eukprot:11045964-Heterocapsa_arctica.AAC.1
MLWQHALLSITRNTSWVVLSKTLTAAYSSALPAVCSMPGTTPQLLSGCPSATHMPQPALSNLGSAGYDAPPSA